MRHNLLIVNGGGPTAVLNATLYGVIDEARKYSEIDKVYGAIGGTEAILKENFKVLSELEEEKLSMLLTTPGTAIGSSRYPISEEDYQKMPALFAKHNIRYVLFNGGNGTMDACGKVHQACEGSGICVVGMPKTIDNDISDIDHSPGFPSAARYIAEVTAEVAQDVKSLPIHVCIIEAMGRNAGWITAASTAARKHSGDAPHLVLVPEAPFDEERFLQRVKELHAEKGGVVVVVSEGLNDTSGESIVPPIYTSGRSIYYGDVSAYLAGLIVKKLGIKARNEKPGLLGRSSIKLQSSVDRNEAIQVGRKAVQSAVAGYTGVMVGILRKEQEDYCLEMPLIPIRNVMLRERKLPPEYIRSWAMDIDPSYLTWLKPLLGEEIPDYISFIEER